MGKTALSNDHLTAILTGDRALLRQLYRELYPMVKSIIQQKGGTEQECRDAFQDAMMVVFSKVKDPKFQLTSQFSTYFCSVAFNQWRSHRKKKVNSEITIPEGVEYSAEQQPEFDHSKLERQKLFDKAFAQLNVGCRELLLLFFQKIPMAEIAKRRGFPTENAARQQKYHCQNNLIHRIKNSPEYQELRNQ